MKGERARAATARGPAVHWLVRNTTPQTLAKLQKVCQVSLEIQKKQHIFFCLKLYSLPSFAAGGTKTLTHKEIEKYVKHVMFSVQIAEFKVSEILLKVREKSGKFFNSDMWQPCNYNIPPSNNCSQAFIL